MTDSHREQILLKIVALLQAANIAGSQVNRSRTTPVPRSEGPTFQVTWKDDLPMIRSVSPSPIDWELNVEIRVIVRGEIPDSVADPFVVAAHNALLSDVSLGNLAEDVTPGQVAFESFDADDSAAIVAMPFMVKYRNTSYSDLTS